ncbi:uncharacterized protein LOC136025287 [Artemia franciscana]|uniref:Uncharacterized protein n=1 Tax=Artemia franciscana TaxID=6661 RepID=A0AA88HZZ3_ARTSF|nr:hypothetical protein QYM36_011675 [Artemia franciscana]
MNLTSFGIPPIVYYYIIVLAGPEWALGPERANNCKLLQEYRPQKGALERNRRSLFNTALFRAQRQNNENVTSQNSEAGTSEPPYIIRLLADDRTFGFSELLESIGTIIVLTAQAIDTSNQTYPNPLPRWARFKGAGYGTMFFAKIIHAWLDGIQILFSKVSAELC